MKAIYTAIIGNYEELKEPTAITPGFDYICFTDQPLKSKVWQIRKIEVEPGLTPQRMARKIKILPHIFLPSYTFTFWLDASFQINCDLTKFVNYFKPPLTCPAHPLRHCWLQEANSCIANKRGNAEDIARQRDDYKALEVPQARGIITSGLLMRDNSTECIDMCNDWWAEVEKYSTRDQLAFARIGREHNHHLFRWDYSQSKELKYIRHFHLRH